MQARMRRLQVELLRYLPYALLLCAFVVFGRHARSLIGYGESIAVQASYIGVVAVGMTIVLLTGGIDLSVGSNMYLSAAAAGLLVQDLGLPVEVALCGCLVIGILFGTANGLLITKLKILPFVATLGTLVAGRGLGLLLTQSYEVRYPDSVLSMGSAKVFGTIPLPVAVFAAVVVGAHLFLTRTQLGRQVYAVGYDREAAAKAGVPTARALMTVYVTAGFLAALGGFVSVAQDGSVSPGFGEGDEFDAIAAAVLGGTSLFGGVGTVFPGTVVGALLIGAVTAGLVVARVDLYLQPLVHAGIIFLAVFLDSYRIRQLARLNRRPIRTED